MPGLEFRDVRKSFGAVQALTRRHLLGAREGEAHALVGENGAGKSTLLKDPRRDHPSRRRRARLAGCAAHLAIPREALERGIGMVYQEMLCFPNLSVTGNIFAGRELTGAGGRLREAEMEARTTAILERAALARFGRAPLPSRCRRHTASCCRWRVPSPSTAGSSCSTSRRRR